MIRILVLGSALTVLAAACFSSPSTLEAEDGGQSAASTGTTSVGSTNGGSSSGATSSGGSTGGSSGQCELPTPGTCSSDRDCVLAFCSNESCNCGGWVIARSQLGENACLIEEGSPIPAACNPPGPACECPAHPFCTPQCISGTCTCELTCGNEETLCNGVCADTSGNLDNCGTCGTSCTSGQLCLNGVCTSDSSGGGSDDGGSDICNADNFCACTNFCVSTCQGGDGGSPLTQACEGALCPNSCPSGEACAAQRGGDFMCTPLCTPDGAQGQGSCQDGMTCHTVCT